MTDNIVTSKSTMGEEAKPVKKATAKKAAAKPKVDAEKTTEAKNSIEMNLIVFECGASYSSRNLSFTKENAIQEVSDEDFAFLLTLENFRRANQFEIEDYLNSKED
jgi:DNA-directed RNA polymerase alpha subunit